MPEQGNPPLPLLLGVFVGVFSGFFGRRLPITGVGTTKPGDPCNIFNFADFLFGVFSLILSKIFLFSGRALFGRCKIFRHLYTQGPGTMDAKLRCFSRPVRQDF